jgi:hypothetical protein
MDEFDETREDCDLFGMEEAALLDREAFDDGWWSHVAIDARAVAEEQRDRQLALARYRCKSNPALTWGGRGRPPRWVVWYLDSGGRLSDLAI